MALTAFSAFAEIASIGAVIPFIAALTQPDRLMSWPIVARLARLLGFASGDELILPLTIGFAVIAVVSNEARMFLLWASARLAFGSGADLSSEVYRRTLYQPYSVHIARNSSEVISGITNKVGGTVLGVMFPLMTLISYGVSLLATLVALLIIDPWLALGAGFGFGACYGIISWFSRRRLRGNSRRIATEYTLVVKALQEGLGGIRDVLLDGSQPVYCDVYRRAEVSLRRAQGDNVFISQSPRFSMEAIGMVLIAGLAFGLSRQSHSVAAALPVLGALALGAQRLLPALQQVYGAWATMAGCHALLKDTLELLNQPLPAYAASRRPPPLPFRREVRFEQVRFRYTETGPWVIDNLNLTISKGARVGLVGGTGSGKSTTLDLLDGSVAAERRLDLGRRAAARTAAVSSPGRQASHTFHRTYFWRTRPCPGTLPSVCRRRTSIRIACAEPQHGPRSASSSIPCRTGSSRSSANGGCACRAAKSSESA